MHASDAAHSVLRIRRTSADIVSGFWALPIQSRQSAELKAHCWHAQAQLTSARLCRWQPPQERMCAAAHAWQPDARDARPTTKLAPDRQPLGRVIGRKRSHSRQLTGNTCKVAAIGLTACVACKLPLTCQVKPDVSFAFCIFWRSILALHEVVCMANTNISFAFLFPFSGNPWEP